MKRISLLFAALCCLCGASVRATIVPSFTVSSLYVCPGGSVVFTNTSFVPAGHHASYYWNFPTGIPFSDNHSTPLSAVTFWTPGAPMIQLQAFDSSDNTYSYFNMSITVRTQPSVAINAIPASAIINCIADSVILKGVALDTTGRIIWTRPSSVTDTAQKISAHVGGSYNVITIDSAGCVSNPQYIWVGTQSPMTVQIGVFSPMTGTTFPADSTSICTGGSAWSLQSYVYGTITGSPTYSWSTGSGLPSITPSVTGEYKLTVTDANGCIGKDSLHVAVYATPNDSIYPSTTGTLCSGNTLVLRAAPGYSYLWTNMYTGTTSTADSVILTNDAYYTLVVTGSGGCTASNFYSATFNPSPDPIFSVSPTVGYTAGTIMDTAKICVNGGSSITATPMDYYPYHSYHWSNGDTMATFPVATTGKLVLSITSSIGCTSKDSIFISAAAAPDSTITPSIIGTLCSGMTDVLHVHSAPGLTTHWSTGSINDSILVTASGSFTAAITNDAGCVSHGTSTVFFNPTPTPSVVAGPCSAIVGVIVSGDSYQWSNFSGIIPGATSPFYGASASGFYGVKETTPAGCSATASYAYVTCGTVGTGTSADSVHAYFSESTMLMCHSGIASFVNLTSAVNPSTIKYAWNFGGGTPATSTASAPPSVSFGVGTHTISLIAHDTVSGELSTFSSTITVDSVAIVAYGYSPVTGYYTTGDTARICSTDSAKVGVLVTEGTIPAYVWSNGSTAANFYENVTGKYEVTVTDSYGCFATDSIYLIVNASPDTTTAISGGHCVGDTVHLSVPAGNTYLWTTSETTHAISVTTSGTYGLTITSPAGCVAHKTYPVTFDPLPTATISVSPAVYSYGAMDTAHICTGTTSFVSLSSFGAYTYSWSTGSSLSSFPVTSGTGIYAVTMTDAFTGCVAHKSVFIWVHADPDSTVTASIAGTLCTGMTQVLHAVPGYSYVWNNGSTADSLEVTMDGMYEVNLTSAYGCMSHSSTYTANFTSLSQPYIVVDPSVCSLACSATFVADSFAWYVGGVQIPGATSQYISAGSPGFYSARAYQNGCSVLTDIVYAGCTSGTPIVHAAGIKIFPNPFVESIMIEADTEFTATLLNVLGQKVAEVTGKNSAAIPAADVPPGSYEVILRDLHGTPLKTAKVVKE